MLFTRLFNWIKYKTLPPSVLFLNRLFVERDSKHRRVTSNLGLTFRNSKWSTYARTNINLSSRTSYLGALSKVVLLVITLIGIYYFSTFYNLNILSSPLYTLLWFISDSDLYLKVAFSSSLLCTVQLALSQTLAKLFGLGDSNKLGESMSGDFKLSLPKRLHKPILHAWLTSDASTQSFEQLFANSGKLSTSPNQLGLYSDLYRASFYLLKSSESVTAFEDALSRLTARSTDKVVNQLGLMSSSSQSNARLLSLASDFNVFSAASNSTPKYFSECDTWTLTRINNEIGLSSDITVSSTGQFYLPTTSYSDLNNALLSAPELSNLKTSLTNQVALIQWNRWLYKYNLLHRSLLKASSSMTFTKRLLSSGFYSSSLSTNNLWAASSLNSNKLDNTNIANIQDNLYGDFLGVSLLRSSALPTSTAFNNSSELTNLKFYELSYHWFIQRFYSLNTLSTNGVVGVPALRTSYLPTFTTSSNLYASSLLNYNLELSNNFASTSSILDSATTLGSAGVNNSNLVQSSTDLYLSYNDQVLFTKSKVESFQNLLRNSSFSSNKFFQPSTLK